MASERISYNNSASRPQQRRRLLVAEIQQSSDTTYRLFDWNRLDAEGKPRRLHVQQGLDVIDFDQGPVEPRQPIPTDRPWVSRLVECDKFVLDRWQISSPEAAGGDQRFHILTVLEGPLRVAGDAADQVLSPGGTVLLPAGVGEVELHPAGTAVLLDAYLP